jgi:hypothetical protein
MNANLPSALRGLTTKWTGAVRFLAMIPLAFAVHSVEAQLMRAEFTGPITTTGSRELSELSPGLKLGSPMTLVFDYPSNLEPGVPRGGQGVEYYGSGGDALGTLRVGSFSAQLDNVSITLYRDAELFLGDGLISRGDLMFFLTTDSPRGSPNFVIWADLLYPTGTFQSYDLVTPPENPLLARLGFGVGFQKDSVVGGSLQIFGDLPGITPVPESTDLGLAAAIILAGAIAWRIRPTATAKVSGRSG